MNVVSVSGAAPTKYRPRSARTDIQNGGFVMRIRVSFDRQSGGPGPRREVEGVRRGRPGRGGHPSRPKTLGSSSNRSSRSTGRSRTHAQSGWWLRWEGLWGGGTTGTTPVPSRSGCSSGVDRMGKTAKISMPASVVVAEVADESDGCSFLSSCCLVVGTLVCSCRRCCRSLGTAEMRYGWLSVRATLAGITVARTVGAPRCEHTLRGRTVGCGSVAVVLVGCEA